MSDVIKPVITGNVIKNGSIVTYQNNTGEFSKRDPDLNSHQASGTIQTNLQNRFDDVRYYSGDTAN
tara:strand:- start:207 stop:404 length:198 start_codon:yes stop_codon:yes gene_type:complete